VTQSATAKSSLRSELVRVALHWQEQFGVAPSITSAISEYDAATLVGMNEMSYSRDCSSRTAVTRGCDFRYNGIRYQVKANRPSGKSGSFVTLVGKASNFDWDKLIWILYDKFFQMQEAWQWDVADYRKAFEDQTRLSPTGHEKRSTALAQ